MVLHFLDLCYNAWQKKNNAVHRAYKVVVGYEYVLGDKEILVKIHRNSHYRN